MAISNPNVGQSKQSDSLDLIGAGAQIGSQFMQLGQMIKSQRENMLDQSKQLLAMKLKDNPNYIQDAPDDVKRLIGLQYNLGADSKEVDDIYNQWANAIKDPEVNQRIMAGLLPYISTTAAAQQPDSTQPPVTPPEGQDQPQLKPVSGQVSGQTTIAKSPVISYEEYRKRTMSRIASDTQNAGADMPTYQSSRQSAMNSPEHKGRGDTEMEIAYDKYLKSGAAADTQIQAYWNEKKYGPKAAVDKLPQENRTTTYLSKDNVKLADVDNGVVKPTAEAYSRQNRIQLLSDLRKQFYPSVDDEVFEKVVFSMNKDALVKHYGSEGAALTAFKRGDWMKQKSGIQLRIASPVEMTAKDVLTTKPNATKTENVVMDKAEKGLDKTVKDLQNLSANQTTYRVKDFDEMQPALDEAQKHMGRYSKLMQNKDTWNTFAKWMNETVIPNMGGYENILATASPQKLEQLKLQADIFKFTEQSKLDAKTLEFREKELNQRAEIAAMEGNLTNKRLNIEMAQLAAATDTNLGAAKLSRELDKQLLDYKEVMLKANKDRAGWTAAQWMLDDPDYYRIFKQKMYADGAMQGLTPTQVEAGMKDYVVMEWGGGQKTVKLTPEMGELYQTKEAKMRGQQNQSTAAKEATASPQMEALYKEYSMRRTE